MASIRPARRRFRRTLVLLASVVAAGALYTVATLPPRSRAISAPVPPNVAFGAYHIHSTRSDGNGSPEEIAAAAARAGLQFIVLTDHGDGTRAPDPPAYRHGVLCIDAVEVTTLDGHVVALGLAGPAPYPLAGRARDVIEDLHRLGARAFVAHPDSARRHLKWQAWTTPYDGVEWLNADSEWRNDSWLRLSGAAIRALVRAPESVASLFSRPEPTLSRWDGATAAREVASIAAVDAHARIGWANEPEPRARTLVSLPSYDTMFRTVAQGVVLDAPLSGRAADDAARVLAALVEGRAFSIVRAIAWPAAMDFTAVHAGQTLRMGDRLESEADVVTFSARAPLPSARLALLHNGRTIAEGDGHVSHTTRPERGAYRVEALVAGHDVPWIVSNPIYVGRREETDATAGFRPPSPSSTFAAAGPWRPERDASSQASIVTDADGFSLDFALGGSAPAGQYAAAVTDVALGRSHSHVQFTGSADRPLRLSVQLRFADGAGNRWRRSVYLDPTPRTFTLSFAGFDSADDSAAGTRPSGRLQSVLFVLDTLNTLPGGRGRIEVRGTGLFSTD
jgi:hypothetical protein